MDLEGKMSTRMTAQSSLVDAVPAAACAPAVRRSITAEAGKALEILAHALEYLTDEYAVSDNTRTPSIQDRCEAIELLMALNRRVYLECPQLPSTATRCRAFLRRCFS